jgi:hypothetical protein
MVMPVAESVIATVDCSKKLTGLCQLGKTLKKYR